MSVIYRVTCSVRCATKPATRANDSARNADATACDAAIVATRAVSQPLLCGSGVFQTLSPLLRQYPNLFEQTCPQSFVLTLSSDCYVPYGTVCYRSWSDYKTVPKAPIQRSPVTAIGRERQDMRHFPLYYKGERHLNTPIDGLTGRPRHFPLYLTSRRLT